MTSNKTITLELSVEHTNLILSTLGQRPFVEVYELIQSIQAQAARQLGTEQGEDEPRPVARVGS